MAASKIKQVMGVKPKSVGGNFEYAAIPLQGLPFLSAALKQYAEKRAGPLYESRLWFEDHYSLRRMDPDKDLQGVDLLYVTCLVNEYPRASEIMSQARAAHPNIKIVGGGPQMGPLPEEALDDGADVIVAGEGEMIIGQLSDLLVSGLGRDDITSRLYDFDGISFRDNGAVVKLPISQKRKVAPPDYIGRPDFSAMLGVDKRNPMLAGVLETVRGCTEKCDYCQVIQQFLSYRRVSESVELDRLLQLQELAADGLIYTSDKGHFTVFVSNDLHVPAARAKNYRKPVYNRTLKWEGLTEGMHFTAQVRAEVGQDKEMLAALRKVGFDRLYSGVESLVQGNLDIVNKNQEVEQLKKDLISMKEEGFSRVAMLIIGLPMDTPENIMEMAREIQNYSERQTYNWLTPLPATNNWNDLVPLGRDGSVLPEGERRPYELYTGRQLVTQHDIWSMEESRVLGVEFMSRLKPVDTLYDTMYRYMHRNLEKRYREEQRDPVMAD